MRLISSGLVATALLLSIGSSAPIAAQEGIQYRSMVEGPIEEVTHDHGFCEGPLWLPDTQEWVFTDIPHDTIFRLDDTPFRNPSSKANGLTLDNEGRLIMCQHWDRRVVRVEKDGALTVLADNYQGTKLNSPNDLCVRSDGTIYFTDPPFGLMYFGPKRERDLDFNGVYMITPKGKLIRQHVENMAMPNGIALSPDESKLYISDDVDDIGTVMVFDVAEDGTLENQQLFAGGMTPDGLKVDVEGNVWVTTGYEVRVFNSRGDHIDSITFPQKPANCSFGGPDSMTLLVTARKSVYKVKVKVPGIHPKGTPKK